MHRTQWLSSGTRCQSRLISRLLLHRLEKTCCPPETGRHLRDDADRVATRTIGNLEGSEMSILNKLYVTLRAQGSYPLNKKTALRAAVDFSIAQIAARLIPGEVCVPFPNETKLLVPPHMKGAAHFIYPGLCEFDIMGFVLHYLQPKDLFVDIGANIGAYTVLAGGVAGSQVMAFEPSPSTFRCLQSNVHLNRLNDRIILQNAALGNKEGLITFSEGLGTENYVQTKESKSNSVSVNMTTLDSALAGRQPAMMKIDVEGFETAVIEGAAETMALPSLQSLIIEKNDGGERYGFDETKLHNKIISLGFRPYAYQPLNRKLQRLEEHARGDIIYLRDLERAEKRIQSSQPFRYRGFSI